jgi:glycosyltransferase involved in cell wall biosynthesis
VYNEEESLPLLWPEIRGVLAQTDLVYEVIFVDDGSVDRSAEIVRAFSDEDSRVHLVRLKANAGETAATDAGLKSVRGRYVVVMDADLQNDPHDIRMLAPRHMGRRHRRVNRAAGDSVVRRISSRVANRVRNALSDETIQDSGCTFRAFRRECLRDLVLYKGFHRFIPTLLKMRGFRVLGPGEPSAYRSASQVRDWQSRRAGLRGPPVVRVKDRQPATRSRRTSAARSATTGCSDGPVAGARNTCGC